MLLSNTPILRHMAAGNIVIDPFDRAQLKNVSYDVRLGEWFWRIDPGGPGSAIFNPFNRAAMTKLWSGPHRAERAADMIARLHRVPAKEWDGIRPDDLVILLAPGEMILGHTEEFIGGRQVCTAHVQARSSAGRSLLTVCEDAGWGDVGYINRWTLEIRNKSLHYWIPLVVGERYAQMVFSQVEAPLPGTAYGQTGKYQRGTTLEEVKAAWRPEDMLPRMYLDREEKEARL
ncbi:deoxycytidine triphosphate deaminase [Candidatus Parcubacteria bacterium]|nr:deoxycytidine triphosphate deaminase [Candidatus Parcubacteria bacterium]